MKFIMLLSGILLAQTALAQDIIILTNGDEIMSKVIEVREDIIQYKKHENLDGPTYSLEKSRIFMIRYPNGTKDVFQDQTENVFQEQTEESESLAATPTSSPNSPSSPALPERSFNINPLGLLQFGPVLQYEEKIGERSYVVPYFRYAYAGVLTHLFWTEFGENNELSPGSAAIGIGVKGFTKDYGSSWYYGALLDFSWTTARYELGSSEATEEKANLLGLIFNFGYRWRFTGGTYLNLGLLAGAAYTLKDEERYIESGELFATYDEITILSMLELSFGWEF